MCNMLHKGCHRILGGNMEKMYYNNREIVLEEQWDDVEDSCEGCVLELENACTRKIVPPQSHYVCAPRNTGQLFIFKFKEEICEEIQNYSTY